MILSVLSWIALFFAEWVLARKLDRMFAPDLLGRLRKTAEQWTAQLPTDVYAEVGAIFPPLPRTSDAKGGRDRPHLSKVRRLLLEGYPPSAEDWNQALLEHWRMKRVDLGDDAQSFFLLPDAAAQPLLRDLANALFRECAHDTKLFQMEMLRRTDALSPPEISRTTPFVAPSEYFAPFEDPVRLFNHAWMQVGRRDLVERLVEFTDSENHAVALLPGRGGIGKSRLLREFARQYESGTRSRRLLFVVPDVPISPSSIDALPNEPLVIVVDDAHRHADISTLLSSIRRRQPAAKVLLSSRPNGVDRLNSALGRAAYDVREILRFEDLGELTREEVKDLARQALGTRQAHLADRLASITRDSPLITVVGGQLIAEGKVHPDLLQQNEEFLHVVLGAFEDVLLGKVHEQIPEERCQDLLRLISAVAPVYPENEEFQRSGAQFLGISTAQLLGALDVLEEAGVLIRRGKALRITPDVLADHLLEDACLTRSGQPTGYGRQVYDAFGSEHQIRVFANLAELDWRRRASGRPVVDLLTNIWSEIEEDFRTASPFRRLTILKALDDVAFYQPGPSLRIVELAISHPSAAEDGGEYRVFGSSISNESVLRELPRLLRRIAYHPEYTSRCCDLLWQLGRDDQRELNPYPEHAIRVLQDLARYDHEKPVGYNEMVLAAVERWMREPDVHDHRHSPCDVLDPLLAKVGESSRTEGFQIVFHPFQVSRERTAHIRERAIVIMTEAAHGDSLKGAVRAVKSLHEVVRNPMGIFGMELSPEQEAAWIPEQLQAMEVLYSVCTRPRDALAYLKCVEAVDWHVEFGDEGPLKERAKEIIASVPRVPDLFLTEALLAHGVGLDLDGEEEDKTGLRRWERFEARRKMAAQCLLEACPDAEEGCNRIVERISTIESAGADVSVHHLLMYLAEADPTYAARLVEIVIERIHTPLAAHLSPLLYQVRVVDEARYLSAAEKILRTGDPALGASLAASLRGADWSAGVSADHEKVFRSLLSNPDPWVRRVALGSLSSLGEHGPRRAIDLALSADIGSESYLAEELCGIFNPKHGTVAEQLLDEEWEILLSRLEAAEDIGGYHAGELLAYAARLTPRGVMRLFLNRLERSPESGSRFRPLPSEFQRDLCGFSESPDYNDILRDIRDRALTYPDSIQYWLPDLYSIVSGYDESGLSVLNEWIESGDAMKIEGASRLLRKAHHDFVFQHIDSTARMLERAKLAGDEVFREVMGNLFSLAISGEYHGTPGQPMPRKVSMQDRAEELAARADLPSTARDFYAALARHAEKSIRDDLARDEERAA